MMKKKIAAAILTLCILCLPGCHKNEQPPVATVEPTSITLDCETLTLAIGETHTFTATVLPENATDKSVSYMVTGEAATVENGVLTAVSVGTATVTATTVNELTAVCVVTVTEADDGQEQTKDGWIYYEDFSSRKAVPTYFAQDVQGLGRVELEDGALRMTTVYGGASDRAFMVYSFKTALPETFVVEAQVCSDSLAFANLLFLYGLTDNYLDTSKIAANVAMDKGSFKNNAGAGWNTSIMPYDNGVWYEVSMLVDTTASAYWLTVDGTTSGRMSFRNRNIEIRTLRFGSETAWADVSYRHIGVRAANQDDFAALPSALDYTCDFAGTTKPQDIVSVATDGGLVDFSTDGQVALSTPTSGTASVSKTFAQSLERKYAAEVTFKNQSSTANTFANVLFLKNSALSGTAANVVTIAVESGNLRYHNGSKWATVPYDGGDMRLIDDAQYTVRVECDGEAQIYKLYISGTNYINSTSGMRPLGDNILLGTFPFRNKNAGDPDAIELAIGAGKNGTKFTVERLKVYALDD